MANAHQIVRAEPKANDPTGYEHTVTKKGHGSQVVLFPLNLGHFDGLTEGEDFSTNPKVDAHHPDETKYRVMPYWMLVVAGLGIFLGCVGKSAQFPLHVWLPDAMEGPRPSVPLSMRPPWSRPAFIWWAAVSRSSPEALIVIAYTGAITLFVAATTAMVMTDIKKVLAYSTVSQLGYMMLALGVGGWVAGLFHLLTHAFFKALLFLGSGSVIYGCHHVQEITEMGGLYRKMKITALTMLMGVLAICGIPLFSGWYSKDAILAQALGFALVNREHFLLFVIPLVTAGLTTYYMFRMWFLTFVGKPRNKEVHDHAHETPWMMTVPLILLAILSVCVAWGLHPWDPEGARWSTNCITPSRAPSWRTSTCWPRLKKRRSMGSTPTTNTHTPGMRSTTP